MPLKDWLAPAIGAPRGRHGIPPELIRRSQRGRLLRAVAELSAERGFNGITAARLTARAGVSRATLYDLFETKDDCYFAAAGEALEHLLALTGAAAASGSPRQRLDAIVDAFMRFCVEHPHAGHLGLVDLAGAGPQGVELRSRRLDELADQLRPPIVAACPKAPALMPELLIGALCEVVGSRLRLGRARELPQLGRELLAGLLKGTPER